MLLNQKFTEYVGFYLENFWKWSIKRMGLGSHCWTHNFRRKRSRLMYRQKRFFHYDPLLLAVTVVRCTYLSVTVVMTCRKATEFEILNGTPYVIRTSAFHYVGVHENISSWSCTKSFTSSVSYITKNVLFCPQNSSIGWLTTESLVCRSLDTPKVCSCLGIHSNWVGGIFLIDIDERCAVGRLTII